MNGSAPNSPATGSQIWVRQNARPNFVIDSIDSPGKTIRVRLTRDEIKRGPSVDTADIELIETQPAVWIM